MRLHAKDTQSSTWLRQIKRGCSDRQAHLSREISKLWVSVKHPRIHLNPYRLSWGNTRDTWISFMLRASLSRLRSHLGRSGIMTSFWRVRVPNGRVSRSTTFTRSTSSLRASSHASFLSSRLINLKARSEILTSQTYKRSPNTSSMSLRALL